MCTSHLLNVRLRAVDLHFISSHKRGAIIFLRASYVIMTAQSICECVQTQERNE